MNKKVLALAIAATMVAPMAAHADVKVSGIIQAEVISLEVADGDENLAGSIRDGEFEDMDRQTLTNDFLGTVLNEGPNHISFEFDEKLGGGLIAEARYIGAFNTSGNYAANLIGEEAWVGLRASNFHMRYGTLTGVYKSSHTLIDPWAFTSLQARSTGGGMSGEYTNTLSIDPNTGHVNGVNVNHHQKQAGLTNDGFVEGALELGINYGGFSASIQGIVDDASSMNGAGLLELRYTAPNFALWLAGAYQDLDDVATDVTDIADDIANDISNVIRDEDEVVVEEENEGLGNWKIGGKYQLADSLTLGLQYEDAEIGTMDGNINSDGGEYILGSLEFTANQISVGGWVAQYMSDIDDNLSLMGSDGEDALSFAVGIKYNFSKRSMVYGGYRQTDSDNDYRDENVVTMGIRHVF